MSLGTRQELPRLYAQIAACSICADVLDPVKAVRVAAASPVRSDLFIVSQALAKGSQLLTGVPYFRPDGTMGTSGRQLEDFLNLLGFTLRPAQHVDLVAGHIEGAAAGFRQAYNSEIVQCFPGREDGRQGDKLPTLAIRRCLDQGYLEREIALMDPRVILVLGGRAAATFFRRFAPKHGRVPPIGRSLLPFDPAVALRSVTIDRMERVAVALIHPSGITAGRFSRFVRNNTALCDKLRTLLA